jgi:sugar lactone lactonase YvrE
LGPGGGDGFCLDRDGNELDFLAIAGDGVTTNCCFGGTDSRTLFATDAVPGRVVAWASMPTPGLQLTLWPG